MQLSSSSSPLLFVLVAANASPPQRTDAAGCWVVRACETVEIAPRDRAVVPIGVRVRLAPGSCASVVPLPALARLHGVEPSAATIEADRMAPLDVLLYNHDADRTFTVRVGDPVAQLEVRQYSPSPPPPYAVLDDRWR